MGCDLVSVHLLTDYSITGKVGECAAYITVLLLLICDVISEKILIKNKGEDKTPHGMILAVISALCLAELLIVEKELKNRILLVRINEHLFFHKRLFFQFLIRTYQNII